MPETRSGIARILPPAGEAGRPSGMSVSRQKPLWKRVWKARWSYVFILMPVAFFAVFVAYPMALAFVASFYNYDNFHWKPLESPFYNYIRALRDPWVRRSYQNVLVLFLVSWVGGQTFSLFIAMGLTSLRRFAGLLRTLYYIPVVTSLVVVATLFRWMFGNDDYHPVNAILTTFLGIKPIRWFYEASLVMPTIAVSAIWLGAGFSIIIWMAGLRGIPMEYYELALLEGASVWQKLWYITLPLLKPIILYQAVTGVIGNFKEFGLVYATMAMEGSGGSGISLSTGAVTPVIMIYQYGFRTLQMGFASALAYILTMILLIFVIIQFKYFGATNTYE